MPIHHETSLANLALYQQALRTAERIKTLRREIDDLTREVHQRLDDLEIFIEEIGSRPRMKAARFPVIAQNAAHKLAECHPRTEPERQLRLVSGMTRGTSVF